MTLLDAYGRAARSGRPVLEEIGVGGVRTRYSSYPSHGLTPERLATIFAEADQGDVQRQAELFEEMEEKDAHLSAVLQTRKLAVAGLEWEVVAASGGLSDELDREAAAFVRETLDRTRDLRAALLDLQDAVGKGFSVLEIVWELAGGGVRVGALRWRHQKMFTFFDGHDICLRPRLLTDGAPVYGEGLPENKFIVHAYGSRSGPAARAGLLRPCAWMYLFKNYAVKDWMIFAERYAQPLRVGKFQPGATEAERKVLRDAVFNLGADAAAVISDSTVIELLGAAERSSSAEVYERLVEFCDRSVSKAVLGHAGSADSTPGRLGGERDAREVRRDLVVSDAQALSQALTHQLVRPLVAYNFGPDANPPVFRLNAEPAHDLGALADTYVKLASLGVRIPPGHLHERFGIPIEGPREGGE